MYNQCKERGESRNGEVEDERAVQSECKAVGWRNITISFPKAGPSPSVPTVSEAECDGFGCRSELSQGGAGGVERGAQMKEPPGHFNAENKGSDII